MEDRLIELLRQTDEALQPPSDPPLDLARRVRTVARRREIIRFTSGTLAAAIAVAFGVGIYTHGWRSGGGASRQLAQVNAGTAAEDLATTQRRLEQLAADVDAALALVKSMRARQEPQFPVTLDSSDDPLDRAQDELNQAAFTMVYQADRKYRELGLKESAVSEYRLAVERFPRTQWAQVARQRLASIATTHGDEL